MKEPSFSTHKKRTSIRTLLDIFRVSTKLGLTSFGGPIAHLGYFHEEYVRRRKWLDEKSYADLVALCQFLPGPASSQVGIGIGVIHSGLLGGIVSFLGFTLPSVIALITLALVMRGMNIESVGWIHGLKLVAVAIVAHAIVGMSQNLTPDLKRKAIALMTLVVTLLWQTTYTQIGIILVSAFMGYLIYQKHSDHHQSSTHFPISRRFAIMCLSLFFALLILLPILREVTSIQWIALFDHFYRSGSLVFGGGHVVLPLLEREFVPSGWVFLAGYGATQAVPGPLFTFAAYLGTVMYGWAGGILATIFIFLPAFLLILGTLPFWNHLRRHPKVKGAMMGVNAAVVGLLISAFYQPIWTSAILKPIDFAFVSILFSMLAFWKLPPWFIVVVGAVGGSLLTFL
ncbi:chromate transporter [Bacillus safensis]|uniref:chromate transporter n=1 Tax=Bacillus safensis TaxID=561879 RepID=UPI001CF0D54E|nr:chromate transporter [Bacillus safensis]MCA6607730.1 chromate transporter [Bacillus safensis]